jgi:hypothetical protein
MTYAHWEGGVKDMAQAYLEHVEQQKCRRSDLQPCFLALASITAIKLAAESKKILPYLQAVDYVVPDGLYNDSRKWIHFPCWRRQAESQSG